MSQQRAHGKVDNILRKAFESRPSRRAAIFKLSSQLMSPLAVGGFHEDKQILHSSIPTPQ